MWKFDFRAEKKTEFKDYKKGHGNYFEVLLGRFQQAKRNAAQTLKSSRDAGDPEHHGNPTTLMHTLIGALEKVAAEYKR